MTMFTVFEHNGTTERTIGVTFSALEATRIICGATRDRGNEPAHRYSVVEHYQGAPTQKEFDKGPTPLRVAYTVSTTPLRTAYTVVNTPIKSAVDTSSKP